MCCISGSTCKVNDAPSQANPRQGPNRPTGPGSLRGRRPRVLLRVEHALRRRRDGEALEGALRGGGRGEAARVFGLFLGPARKRLQHAVPAPPSDAGGGQQDGGVPGGGVSPKLLCHRSPWLLLPEALPLQIR